MKELLGGDTEHVKYKGDQPLHSSPKAIQIGH